MLAHQLQQMYLTNKLIIEEIGRAGEGIYGTRHPFHSFFVNLKLLLKQSLLVFKS